MSIIVLNATTKSIEALLEGAVAANQPEFSAHYADVTATAFTEGENDGVLNNTTAVSLVAAPAAATRRIVKEIVIYNADTAAVTVTIRINNNGSYRRIQKVTLAAGATWKLSDGGVSTSSGSGDVVGPASATDGHLAVFDGPTGKLLKDGGAVPAGGGGGASTPPGRLTLESGVPVSITDQVDKTTLYYALMTGKIIQLWNGSVWAPFTIASEPSLNISAFTASKPYDIFIFPNSTTPTLEGLAWTNLTTRATALAYQDGWLIKSGDASRLYLGTIYVDSGQKCQDTVLKRYVNNYYNTKRRKLLVRDTTGSWTYTSTTWRQANNSFANQVQVVVGTLEKELFIQNMMPFQNQTAGKFAVTAIGEDTTSAPTADIFAFQADSGTTGICSATSTVLKCPSIGFHYYAMLERVDVGTVAFYGYTNGIYQSGMFGYIEG